MGVVKVTLNNDTLIDITDTTVVASEMFATKVATGVDGEKMTGTYVAPTPKTASDVTVSGPTVTIPAGAYASQVTKSVATTTQATPSISFDDESGIITATASQTEGYVSAGTKSATETLDILNDDDIAFAGTTRTGKRVTVGIGYSPGISKQIPDGSATTPATTITANPTISVSSNGLITAVTSASEDIEPVTSEGWIYDDFGGVAGTVTVSGSATSQLTTQAAKTVTPTESEQTAVAANRYTTGEVKVGAISSTYVGSGIAQRDSDDLTANGATITAPAGYYSASASKSVASGTAGTPTASKGTVSNHSVTVTPSVTNTTGYITGGTKSGTGVTVAASELVSGTLSVTENGTADVTNYASVDVSVETEPTIESLTVTPSETQQVFDGSATVGSQVASVSFTSSGTKNLSSALTAGEEYYVTTRVSTNGGTTYRTVYEDITEIPNSGGVSVGANVTLSSTSATLSSNTYDRVIVTVYEVTVLDGYLPVTVNAISSTYVGSGVPTKSATSYTPTTTNQTIASGQYLTGNQTILGDANLVASNIASGVSIFGVVGTFEGGIVPSGTYTVSSDGTYDISSYASVEVATHVEFYKRITLNSQTLVGSQMASDFANLISGSIQRGQFARRMFQGNFEFPNVTAIGGYAFENCGGGYLYSATFSFPRVTLIGDGAFMSNNQRNTLDFPEASIIGVNAFQNAVIVSISAPKCVSIGANAFYYTSFPSAASIYYPSCTSIGQNAFSQARFLEYVEFPECSSIPYGAFDSCASLLGVSFPKCENAGYRAFCTCSRLQSISFSLCSAVSGYAFASCSALSSVSLPVCETIGGYAFQNCYALTEISLPSCSIVGQNAFINCRTLSNVNMPLVEIISTAAFQGCSMLSTIDLSCCSIIYTMAFYSCSGLMSAILPACISVYSSAFYQCYSLQTIVLPSCTTISNNVFIRCSALQSISLPFCTTFGQYVFSGCSMLESVYLLGSVVPSFQTSIFYQTPMQFSSYLGHFGSIYVRASLVDSFKTATNFATYSARIVGLTDEEIAALDAS